MKFPNLTKYFLKFCLATLAVAFGANQVMANESTEGQHNARMVVPENLQQSPDVKVVSPDDDGAKEIQQESEESDRTSSPADRLKELQEDLNLEKSQLDGQPVLGKADQLMEISRLPLTYVQEHVPFLTRRNIIFLGRMELDYANYSSGVLEDDSGFIVRQLRVGLAGRFRVWDGWNYKVEFDFTDSENTVSDAFLSWRSGKWGTFRIGNQKVAQTLSGHTSSLSIPFMERALPIDTFSLRRRLGLSWDAKFEKFGFDATVFGRDLNEDNGDVGWAVRSYFNPSRSDYHVIHIGGSYMQLSSDNDAQFRANPESKVTDLYLVDTGVWPNVNKGSTVGLELAGGRGPVTLRSEIYLTKWSQPDADDPNFKGMYVEASWFLTGETALYRDGKFIRPNINSPRGAWELAARFSSVDLNDLDVQGGTEKNLSFGVNWYSQTHWRFMGNVIKVRSDDGPYGEQKPWIVQVRAQYFF